MALGLVNILARTLGAEAVRRFGRAIADEGRAEFIRQLAAGKPKSEAARLAAEHMRRLALAKSRGAARGAVKTAGKAVKKAAETVRKKTGA